MEKFHDGFYPRFVVLELCRLDFGMTVHVEYRVQLVYELGPLLFCEVVRIHNLPEVRLGLCGYIHVADAVFMGIPYVLRNLYAVCGISLLLGLEYYVQLSRVQQEHLPYNSLKLPCEVVGAGSSLDGHYILLPDLGKKIPPSFRRHASGEYLSVLKVLPPRQHACLERPLRQIHSYYPVETFELCHMKALPCLWI